MICIKKLTFCVFQIAFGQLIFLLENIFIFQESQSARNLLRRHGVSTFSIQKVCVTGSASAVQITFSTILLLGLAYLF